MNRRGFLQSLAAGAAVIMLPALAEEAVPELLSAAPEIPTTAAGLTTWMRGAFNVTDVMPAAFATFKKDELLGFGVNLKDVPKEKLVYDPVTAEPVAAKFDHFIIAYGIEGDDPVKAEQLLVSVVYNNLNTLTDRGALFLRVAPTFSHEKMTEYGDTYMTWEDLQDKGMPDALPENVELDWDTDSLRYVKRRYTLNKLRLRLSLPTLPEDQAAELSIIEGTSPKRIT